MELLLWIRVLLALVSRMRCDNYDGCPYTPDRTEVNATTNRNESRAGKTNIKSSTRLRIRFPNCSSWVVLFGDATGLGNSDSSSPCAPSTSAQSSRTAPSKRSWMICWQSTWPGRSSGAVIDLKRGLSAGRLGAMKGTVEISAETCERHFQTSLSRTAPNCRIQEGRPL